MKYDIIRTGRFKKDYKQIKKRGYDVSLLAEVVGMLAAGKPLPGKYRDHPLSGNWIGYRDCHIQSDWVLIYRIEEETLVLVLTRTGTHSDVF